MQPLPLSVLSSLTLAASFCKLPRGNLPPAPQNGVDAASLGEWAKALRLRAVPISGESLAQIQDRQLAGPVILILKNGESILLIGQVRARSEAVLLIPENGKVRQSRLARAELEKAWSGTAILLEPIRQNHRLARALVSVARHYGRDLALEDVLHDYLLTEREPDEKLFLRILSEHGFEGRRAKVELDGIAQMPSALPAILHLRNGAILVLWQLDPDGSLEVENPDQPDLSRIRVSRQEIDSIFDGNITFIKPLGQNAPAGIDTPPPRFGLEFFWREIKGMKGNMLEVGLAAIALQAIGLAMPLFFQIIIDRVVTHHAESTLQVLALGMLGAIIFESAFSWLRSYLLLYATSVIDLRLAIKTFDHLSAISLPFFERVPSGVLIKHMQQPEKIREFLTGKVFGALLDSISLFVVLPILFAYSWRLTLLVLGFSLICALVIYLAMGPFRARLQDLYATEGERQAFLVENIHAMPTVKSLSLEPLRKRGWDNRAAIATGMRFRVGKMSLSISAFMQFMQKCMTLGILWWGVYLIFDNTMTVGALVAFNMYSARVSGPLVQLAGLIQQYQEANISIKMLGQIMDEPREGQSGRGVLPQIQGAVRCRDITFRYKPDSAPALSGVSFEFPAGSVIGVVGRSGSGKSTLTRLLQRIQPLQEGDIWIDGHNIRDLDMPHLRRSIGVVLQDNFIFRGRVRDNIAVTKPSATLEEIMHAARMAAAHEFIESLPDGYNTILEESGSNLSGGQRQRLAIARALLTDPRLIIFDEATSALDPESEAQIQANIGAIAKGRTMIIVSHRLSMLRNADAILVLDKGRLAGMGSHEQLYGNCQLYRSLWDTQNGVRGNSQ